MMHEKYLTYEQFGAKGDGITNDQHAIFECHSSANKQGIPVKARDGARYYIGCEDLTAIIRTDVYFGTAEFIIDDTNVVNRKSAVFKVESDYEMFPIYCTNLSCEQSSINNPISEELFVKIRSDEKKVFIRRGLNQNEGVGICDCFILDANGRIKNKVNWNYAKITNACARKIDNKQIVIDGGVFTTIANKSLPLYNYYERGIIINRDKTIVKNIKHYIVNEEKFGAPYRGFLSIIDCTDVVIRDCIFTPHRTYLTASKVFGKLVPMGTYDIYLESSIRVKLYNIEQTIDIMNPQYWGIMSSNFCKEITLYSSVLSRFDAHMGVTDVNIHKCRFGYQGINVIGFGDMIVEDSIVESTNYIILRSDYGASWNGRIIIRKGVWRPNGNDSSIISAFNDEEHDFGYQCQMPETIIIDGFLIDVEICNATQFYVLSDLSNFKSLGNDEAKFNYLTTRKMYVSNVLIGNRKKLIPCKNYEQYQDLKMYFS